MSGTRQVTIDWKLVDRLLESGNDGIRAASHIGIHANTLYRRCEEEHGISFGDYLATKRKRGESLIIAKQFEIAMKGDKTMLIWVGKQVCGQKDNKTDEKDGIITNLLEYIQSLGKVPGTEQLSKPEMETDKPLLH